MIMSQQRRGRVLTMVADDAGRRSPRPDAAGEAEDDRRVGRGGGAQVRPAGGLPCDDDGEEERSMTMTCGAHETV